MSMNAFLEVVPKATLKRFEEHMGGYQALIEFPNGYCASIIGGGFGQCGDGINTFELAVLKNGAIDYTTPITGDVLGWQSKDEIIELLKRIGEQPAK